MELDAIPQPELDQIERIGSADLVIGIFELERQEEGATAVTMAREALAEFSKPLRAMVVCNNGTHGPPAAESEEAGGDHLSAIASCSLPLPGPAETPQQTISNAYRKIFAVGSKLGVRACGVIASRPQTVTPGWIYRLVQPVLDLGFDLVAPCYTREKMEGLLNRSILSPLHRSLYGEQLQNPMGPDFGLSGKLLQRVLGQDSARRGGLNQSLASDRFRCGVRQFSSLRIAFGSSHAEPYGLGEFKLSTGGGSGICISRNGRTCRPLAEHSRLEDSTEIRPARIFASRCRTPGRPRHDRIISIGNAKPSGCLGPDSASFDLVGIEEAVPAARSSIPAARPPVGPNRLRFCARTPATNDQPRSSSPIDYATLSGVDRVLRARNANRRTGGSGLADRAPFHGI